MPISMFMKLKHEDLALEASLGYIRRKEERGEGGEEGKGREREREEEKEKERM